MGCGGLAILGALAVVLLTLGAILGRSDIDVEPIEDPVEDILDEQEENEPAQVQPVITEPENAAGVVLRVSGQQGTAYSGPTALPKAGCCPWRAFWGPYPQNTGSRPGVARSVPSAPNSGSPNPGRGF
jgi:hypothetical protein